MILGLCPEARLVDLSQAIALQNVAQAAYVLSRAVPYFPAGTIHLAVAARSLYRNLPDCATRMGISPAGSSTPTTSAT